MHGNRVACLTLLSLGILSAGCRRALTHEGPGPIELDAGTSGDASPSDAIALDLAVDVTGSEPIPIPPHDTYNVCSTPPLTRCPTEEPVTGACTGNWTCQDGDPVDLLCRRRWSCLGGVATVYGPCGDGGSMCPPAPGSGDPCTGTTGCSYADGAYCLCARFGGGSMWFCTTAPSSSPSGATCPAQLPFAGTACDQDLVDCMYGGCDGMIAACCGGVWVLLQHICANPV